MKQREDNERDSKGASQSGAPAGVGQGRADGGEDPLASGSPKNLVPVAMAVGLLCFAGVVFFVMSTLGDSDMPRDNWQFAGSIMKNIAAGVFWSGLLVGLGTFAIAGSKGASSSAGSVVRLLFNAGIAIVILAVAESVCMVRTDVWSGWRGEASGVAFLLAERVFQAGVLAGFAVLCQRAGRSAGAGDQQP